MPRLRLGSFLPLLIISAALYIAFRAFDLSAFKLTSRQLSSSSSAGIAVSNSKRPEQAANELVYEQTLDAQQPLGLKSNNLESAEDVDIREPYIRRIVAVGDLHGDYGNALKVLQMAGVTDIEGNWMGGADLLVQTGDIIDRGTDTIKIFLWLEKLRSQARNAGGDVISHLGNHEWMNMLADWRYVTQEEIKTFGSVPARVKMLQTGRIGRAWAANYSITSRVPLHPPMGAGSAFPSASSYAHDAQSVSWDPSPPSSAPSTQRPPNPLSHAALSFVHGGLAPTYPHLTPYPDKINALGRTLLQRLQTRAFPPPHPPAPYAGLPHDASPEEHSLYMDSGPLWYRGWAQNPTAAACKEVDEVLEMIGVRRLIMGHTPNFEHIVSRCGGKIIIIDTGISHAYGGALSALSVEYSLTPKKQSHFWTEREVVTAIYPDHQNVLLVEERPIAGEL